MTNLLDFASADKWRAVIADFDAKRAQFLREFASLRTFQGKTPALEAKRQELLKRASVIQGSMDKLLGALDTARQWLNTAKDFFGLNGVGIALPLAPIALAVSLASVAAIVVSITGWLKDVAYYNAGGVPNAGSAPSSSSAKLFGFDVRWILAIGAMFIAGPYVIKGLERYRVLK